MKILKKIKDLSILSFNKQPILTSFFITFVPLYCAFILPKKYKEIVKSKALNMEENKLSQEWMKINSLQEAKEKYHQKWDNINNYDQKTLNEKEQDINLLSQLSIDMFMDQEPISILGNNEEYL